MYLQQGKFYLALAYFNAALKIEPKNVVALAQRGEVYHLTNRLVLAEDYLITVLSMNVQSSFILVRLGFLYYLRGKEDQALAILKEIPKSSFAARIRKQFTLIKETL